MVLGLTAWGLRKRKAVCRGIWKGGKELVQCRVQQNSICGPGLCSVVLYL